MDVGLLAHPAGVLHARGRRVDHHLEGRHHPDLHVSDVDDLHLRFRLVGHAWEEEVVHLRFGPLLAGGVGVLGLGGVLGSCGVAAQGQRNQHSLAGGRVPVDAPERVAGGQGPEQGLAQLVRAVEAVPLVGQQGLKRFGGQHIVVVLGAGHGRINGAALGEHRLLAHDQREDLIVSEAYAPR